MRRTRRYGAGWLAVALLLGGCGGEDLGERIATEGNERGATACVDCHGTQGEGQAQPPFPRLAALPAPYLKRQIEAYAAGERENPTMAPIAEALDDDERDAVARYYAGLPPAGGDYEIMPELADLGERIVRQGVQERDVLACATCHGVEGREATDEIPPLAGQPPRYLLRTLEAYAEETRRTDPDGVMQAMAAQMEQRELAAVAAWYSTQPVAE